METMKCLRDIVNIRWLKGQKIVSILDWITSAEMNECCSVQVYIIYHVCTPAVTGHHMYEVDVQEAP